MMSKRKCAAPGKLEFIPTSEHVARGKNSALHSDSVRECQIKIQHTNMC